MKDGSAIDPRSLAIALAYFTALERAYFALKSSELNPVAFSWDNSHWLTTLLCLNFLTSSSSPLKSSSAPMWLFFDHSKFCRFMAAQKSPTNSWLIYEDISTWALLIFIAYSYWAANFPRPDKTCLAFWSGSSVSLSFSSWFSVSFFSSVFSGSIFCYNTRVLRASYDYWASLR